MADWLDGLRADPLPRLLRRHRMADVLRKHPVARDAKLERRFRDRLDDRIPDPLVKEFGEDDQPVEEGVAPEFAERIHKDLLQVLGVGSVDRVDQLDDLLVSNLARRDPTLNIAPEVLVLDDALVTQELEIVSLIWKEQCDELIDRTTPNLIGFSFFEGARRAGQLSRPPSAHGSARDRRRSAEPHDRPWRH